LSEAKKQLKFKSCKFVLTLISQVTIRTAS